MHLVMVSDGWEHPKEASLKVSRRLDMRKPVKTTPVLQVSSWSLGGHGGSWCTWWWSQMKENIQEKLPWKFHEDWTTETLSRLQLSSKSLLESWRTWRFLTYLVMVSDWSEHQREASLKVSWRLDNRNPVKTPPVLQVSSWSLGGRGGSWPTLWWSQMEVNIQEKLPWKFHEVWTSETLSRLPLSSKSLPGVLEDMEVPDEEGSGWGVTFVTKRISLDNVLNNIGLIWDLQKEITNVNW